MIVDYVGDECAWQTTDAGGLLWAVVASSPGFWVLTISRGAEIVWQGQKIGVVGTPDGDTPAGTYVRTAGTDTTTVTRTVSAVCSACPEEASACCQSFNVTVSGTGTSADGVWVVRRYGVQPFWSSENDGIPPSPGAGYARVWCDGHRWFASVGGSGCELSFASASLTPCPPSLGWTRPAGAPGGDCGPSSAMTVASTTCVPGDASSASSASSRSSESSLSSMVLRSSQSSIVLNSTSSCACVVTAEATGAQTVAVGPLNVDGNWTVNGGPAYAVSVPSWVAPTPGTSWISHVSPVTGITYPSPQSYDYETTVSINGWCSGFLLEMFLAADDDVHDIVVNGVATGIEITGAWSEESRVLLTEADGLVEGANTIKVVVRNSANSTGDNPAGLYARFGASICGPVSGFSSSSASSTSGSSMSSSSA